MSNAPNASNAPNSAASERLWDWWLPFFLGPAFPGWGVVLLVWLVGEGLDLQKAPFGDLHVFTDCFQNTQIGWGSGLGSQKKQLAP